VALGSKIFERLEHNGFLGVGGRIDQLEKRLDAAFAALSEKLPGGVTSRSGLGAMQAFVVWNGDPDVTSALIKTCLDEGVLVQPAGAEPMKVRLLPPLNLTDGELSYGFGAIERAIRRVADQFGLSTV